MKKTLYLFCLLLFVVAALPNAASASTVQSTSVSSSDTGGITAGAGQSVTTNASDAYSEVRTIVSGSSSSSGTSTLYIETNTDGVVHKETITKIIPPGGNISVEANVTAGNRAGGGTTSAPRIRIRVGTTTTPILPVQRGGIFSSLSHLFQTLFGWFGR